MLLNIFFKGKLLLRIDDTDENRNIQGSEEKIIELLNILKVNVDFKIKQSERSNFYKFIINEMINYGYLKYCKCNEKICLCLNLNDGALRLINIKFESVNDLLHKDILNDQFENIILVRNNGMPTYHLASCIDDFLFKIHTIIRSIEWLPYINLHYAIFKILNKIFEMKQKACNN